MALSLVLSVLLFASWVVGFFMGLACERARLPVAEPVSLLARLRWLFRRAPIPRYIILIDPNVYEHDPRLN